MEVHWEHLSSSVLVVSYACDVMKIWDPRAKAGGSEPVEVFGKLGQDIGR